MPRDARSSRTNTALVPFANAALLLCAVLVLAPTSARAGLFSLMASGTISENSSGDSTIAVGTPWAVELTYDTTAPDLDFEVTGSPDPTFGRFTNTGATPALTFFRYRAGSYEVTIDDSANFGAGSEVLITFSAVHAIDVNVHAPTLFPPLGGGVVSFHADFNDFSSRPIFVSDALPTDPALGPGSFDETSATLLPPSGVVSSNNLAELSVTAVPEPSTCALTFVGLLFLSVRRRASRT